jgi:hypothetical protein
MGDLPRHYATEYLTIAYRTDPAAITAYLPRSASGSQNWSGSLRLRFSCCCAERISMAIQALGVRRATP